MLVEYCYHCHSVYCKLNQLLFLEYTYIVKFKKIRNGWHCYYYLSKLLSENVGNRPEKKLT